MQKRKCKSCDFCKNVFMRSYCRIWKGKSLYCVAREEMTAADGGCGRWRAQRQGYDLSARRFAEAEEDLAALLRLVREE